jgi:RNase adaptor protein for sRNA GlmZ degradation
MSLVILTGASGSGKTTIATEFSKRHSTVAQTCFFDSIGVPTPDEMVSQFGSGEEWQRLKTMDWLLEINARLSASPILFEGQMRLGFIHEAAKSARISNYTAILVHCDDQTRRHRLSAGRRQAHLASDEMMNWAHYLWEESRWRGDKILDTSNITVSEAVEIVRQHF